ncbi:MAG: 30S ribosomal protein S20 [Firmicutes bacterium]|nr:30S ribosomal protein S20 [Bacillota bacterium]
MANTKSAKKMIKISEKKRLRNLAIKTKVKSLFKKASEAVEEKNLEESKKTLLAAIKAADSAVLKKTVHKNKVARKKSRLQKKYNELLASK